MVVVVAVVLAVWEVPGVQLLVVMSTSPVEAVMTVFQINLEKAVTRPEAAEQAELHQLGMALRAVLPGLAAVAAGISIMAAAVAARAVMLKKFSHRQH